MIYFLQDSANLHIKIGFSKNDAEARASTLQCGNSSALHLLATAPGDMSREKELHRQFASARVAGEWFRPVPELIRLVGGAMASEAPPKRKRRTPRWPMNIYLAGKVSGPRGQWRSDIVEGWPGGGLSGAGGVGGLVGDRLYKDWPIAKGAIFGRHHYVGPYVAVPPDAFEKSCHGSMTCMNYPPPQMHGDYSDNNYSHDGPYSGGRYCEDRASQAQRHALDSRRMTGINHLRDDILKNCYAAIDRCDLFFAWMDASDCYGTLVEIGYAKASGVPWVVICNTHEDPELWFCEGQYIGHSIHPYRHLGPSGTLRGHIGELAMFHEGSPEEWQS